MANTEHKQIPRVQWHTPHFCPLLDVTNTRGGRAKGRTLSDLVIQNFSHMLSAVWDYSRLPMPWVSNARCAAKQLPGKLSWSKRGKTAPAHSYRHPPSVCPLGTLHHFGLLLNYCLVTFKPQHRERFCQVCARDEANAKGLGPVKNTTQILPTFSILCSR